MVCISGLYKGHYILGESSNYSLAAYPIDLCVQTQEQTPYIKSSVQLTIAYEFPAQVFKPL